MRAEKELLLEEIKEKIDGSKGFLITRYAKLTSDRARSFRDMVEEAEGEFEAVKKRVFAKALLRSNYKIKCDEYEGHVGILFSRGDIMALSKKALKFSEDNDQAIELMGGMVDGEFLSAADVVAIAKLPSLNELRAQFLSILAGPMQETVTVIDAFVEKQSKESAESGDKASGEQA